MRRRYYPIQLIIIEFAGTLTATTFDAGEFGGDNAGKMIRYLLRWQLKDETYSAWSETLSATVTG